MFGKPYHGYEVQQAFAVHKGDSELLAKINASLAKLKANGTVDKILDKWGLKAKDS